MAIFDLYIYPLFSFFFLFSFFDQIPSEHGRTCAVRARCIPLDHGMHNPGQYVGRTCALRADFLFTVHESHVHLLYVPRKFHGCKFIYRKRLCILFTFLVHSMAVRSSPSKSCTCHVHSMAVSLSPSKSCTCHVHSTAVSTPSL